MTYIVPTEHYIFPEQLAHTRTARDVLGTFDWRQIKTGTSAGGFTCIQGNKTATIPKFDGPAASSVCVFVFVGGARART